MRMSLVILMAMVTAGAVPTPAAPSDHPRYGFEPVDDGAFLRLDRRTGWVSPCHRQHAVGWTCRMASEERIMLEDEVGRLQSENAVLKKAVASHGLWPPSGGQSAPPAPRAGTAGSSGDVGESAPFIERIWRRVVKMVARLQRDVRDRS